MSFSSLVTEAESAGSDHGKRAAQYGKEIRLDALGISIPPDARVLEIGASFAQLQVDVLAESLVPEGFILAETNSGVGEQEDPLRIVRRIWKRNRLDTQFHLAVIEALVQGKMFWVLGPGRTPDVPRITAHTREGMATHRDMYGDMDEALRRYDFDDEEWASYYTAEQTVIARKEYGRWRTVNSFSTNAGRVPVFEMTNRNTIGSEGESEMALVEKEDSAASRTLTNLQVAQELLAMPMRYLFGGGGR